MVLLLTRGATLHARNERHPDRKVAPRVKQGDHGAIFSQPLTRGATIPQGMIVIAGCHVRKHN